MGDMADLMEEQMWADFGALDIFDEPTYRDRLDDDFFGILNSMTNKHRNKELHWTTNDGREILVQDMSDSHLFNTINFIKRGESTNLGDAWIEILELETNNR